MKNIGRLKLRRPITIQVKPHDTINHTMNYLRQTLGEAIIENSKSICGYFKIPFILWSIKKEYKTLEKLNTRLAKESDTISYSKDFIRYKLGEALIKASDTWYKGGLIKFYFKAKEIEKEHKKR